MNLVWNAENNMWKNCYLHHLDLSHVQVLGVLQLQPRLVQRRLHLHGLVVQHGELALQALVLGRLHDH